MTSPVVSVHMITYNHAPYIREAIESVLAQQTDFPFELVIGEDHSPDNTLAIVREYQQRHPDIIRVITSDQNVGMARNARRTFEACTGKYIAYCEGDDYWNTPLKLQKQVDFLEANPSCSLVCSDYDILFEDTGRRLTFINRQNNLQPGKIDQIKSIIRGTPSSGILTCTVMARRDLVALAVERNPAMLGGDTPQPCGDTPTWAGLFVEGRIGYIDESLATYRRIDVSATRNPSKAALLRTSIAMKRQMLEMAEMYNVDETEKSLHRLDLNKRLLRLAYFERDAALAREAFDALTSRTLLDRVLLFGAGSNALHTLVRPWVGLFARPLIPTTEKP